MKEHGLQKTVMCKRASVEFTAASDSYVFSRMRARRYLWYAGAGRDKDF